MALAPARGSPKRGSPSLWKPVGLRTGLRHAVGDGQPRGPRPGHHQLHRAQRAVVARQLQARHPRRRAGQRRGRAARRGRRMAQRLAGRRRLCGRPLSGLHALHGRAARAVPPGAVPRRMRRLQGRQSEARMACRQRLAASRGTAGARATCRGLPASPHVWQRLLSSAQSFAEVFAGRTPVS